MTGSMGNATTVPDASTGTGSNPGGQPLLMLERPYASMTRREFVGWMLASIAAMVAGARIWRLFRQAAERGEAYGVITEIDQTLGSMTIEWVHRDTVHAIDQHGRPWTAAIERRSGALTAGNFSDCALGDLLAVRPVRT